MKGKVAGTSPGDEELATSSRGASRRIQVVIHLGREHFRIKTTAATYLYDPVAGGFSSIIDQLGNDWVSYDDAPSAGYPAGAANKYRGVPNLVYQGEDDGAGHPGFRKCESRITGKNQITTVSLSGAWAWRWTFYRHAARLEVTKVPDDRAYWFLYEGPAGGQYRPRSTFWATDVSDPSYTIHDHYAGDIYRARHRYLFFGEAASPFLFFMLQATPDDQEDHVSYLGNQEIGARSSPDGMVVAGFGRAAGAKPLLSGLNTFLIGFLNYTSEDPLAIPKARQRLERMARRHTPKSRAN